MMSYLQILWSKQILKSIQANDRFPCIHTFPLAIYFGALEDFGGAITAYLWQDLAAINIDG